MKKFIIRLARKILGRLDPPDPRFGRAVAVVQWAELAFAGKRGDQKRSQALSKLAHEFPDARLRDLALLIELAVQELK